MTSPVSDSSSIYAKIVSVIFHPLLMPLYGLAILLSQLTPFGVLPVNVKRLLFLIVIVNNVVLPLSMLPFLMQMNFISSLTLREREERAVPMIITTILYASTSYIIYRFPIPHFLKSYFFSTFLLSLVLTVINFNWKISLHSVGAGALFSLILILTFFMSLQYFIIVVIMSVLTGFILSSRLQLRMHSPEQVWAGFFTGLTAVTLFILLFQNIF